MGIIQGSTGSQFPKLLLIFHHFLVIFSFKFGLTDSLNEEGIFLLEFKTSVSDPNNNLQSWTYNSSSHATPCEWKGVKCTSDFKVTSLYLSGLNLSGTLSPSLCNKLPNLTEFNVSKNFFSGSIPNDFSNCHSLQVLDLCTNRLHAQILTPICRITTLRKLYLCENYIYGNLPGEIGNLTSLEELVIYSNNLTGSIPASIGRLKELKIIRAGGNSLSGSIPDEIGECQSLKVLGLAQNKLEGELPAASLHKLKNLTDLILWQNSLSGSIPLEIGDLSSLELLALHENSSSGILTMILTKRSL